MPVKKRFDYKGCALVYCTTTINDWYPIFSDKTLAIILLEQLEETLKFYNIPIISYVLMPSHLHMMIYLVEYAQLSKFMQSFKSLSSRKIKEVVTEDIKNKFIFDSKFKLWMPRFDDLIIYSEEQIRRKIEYIHNNPVRGMLVGKAEDFEFSSAKDWLTGNNGLIKIDKSII